MAWLKKLWWKATLAALAAALVLIFVCLGWKWGLLALAVTYYISFVIVGGYIASWAAVIAEMFGMIFLSWFFCSIRGSLEARELKEWREKVRTDILWFSLTFPFTWWYHLIF